MSDVFAPVPAGLRRERLEAYAAFLAERDGDPDLEERVTEVLASTSRAPTSAQPSTRWGT